MSCAKCGADVPVIPSADDPETVVCARCRRSLAWSIGLRSRESAKDWHRIDQHSWNVQPSGSPISPSRVPPLVATDDDWDDLYAPESFVRATTHAADRLPHDAMTTGTSASHVIPSRERRFKGRPRTWLQWSVLTLGIAMFSAGAVLIAWSFGDGNQALWNLGAPLALAGQVAFLIGLVLQLDILWQQGKWTSQQIDQLDRLVPHPGARPQAPHSPSAHAGTIGPEMMLDDLRVRLDRLGSQLHRQVETRR